MTDHGKWICKKCANYPHDCIIIAGIGTPCYLCGLYAYSYFEKKEDKWIPKHVMEIH